MYRNQTIVELHRIYRMTHPPHVNSMKKESGTKRKLLKITVLLITRCHTKFTNFDKIDKQLARTHNVSANGILIRIPHFRMNLNFQLLTKLENVYDQIIFHFYFSPCLQYEIAL